MRFFVKLSTISLEIKMPQITITITKEITDEIVDHVLTGAELGSDYWASDFDWKRSAEGLVIGADLTEDEADGIRHNVTAEKIAEAIRKICTREADVRADICEDVMSGVIDYASANWDAETYDTILQIALFNELVYG